MDSLAPGMWRMLWKGGRMLTWDDAILANNIKQVRRKSWTHWNDVAGVVLIIIRRTFYLKVHLNHGMVAFECFVTSSLFWTGLPHDKVKRSSQITHVRHHFLFSFAGIPYNCQPWITFYYLLLTVVWKTADSAFAFSPLQFPSLLCHAREWPST